MAALFLLNPPKTKRARKRRAVIGRDASGKFLSRRRRASQRGGWAARNRRSVKRSRRRVAAKQGWKRRRLSGAATSQQKSRRKAARRRSTRANPRHKPRTTRRGGSAMARKTKRRRRSYTRRNGPGKAKRRAAALKGWRRKKARRSNPRRKASRRRRSRRNPRGLFPSKGRRGHRARAHRSRRSGRIVSGTGGGAPLFARNPKRRRKASRRRRSNPRRHASRRRSSRRRRNPNGFIGELMRMGTWQAAGGIALGAVGSTWAAAYVQRYLPAAVTTGTVGQIVSPLSKAVVGALLGWGLSAVGFRGLGKSVATGGVVAAAIDVVGAVGKASGLLGYGDYVQLSDYVQLQGLGGLGTQAQVEAGVFGLGTQAQVEAGVFGLGHSDEALSAQQTFGPTF